MSRGAAFFDLDKTLMAGSSGMQFARVAAQHGIVSRRQLASWGFEHLRYRLRGTTDERTGEVLRAARELIRGVDARTVDRMEPEVMAAILPRVFPEMLAEVHAHQDAGRATFIVSAAGHGIVESLARVLGMEGGIGTRYEVDAEGSFTDAVGLATLLANSKTVAGCFQHQLFRFASGRSGVDEERTFTDFLRDRPSARDGKIIELLVDYAQSDSFVTRRLN